MLDHLESRIYAPADSATDEMLRDLGGPAVQQASVFISYSHKDKSFRDKLETHLSGLVRQGIIKIWDDCCIGAGEEIDKQIIDQLKTADIILLLISSDFIHSDYCHDTEMRLAMERHEQNSALVIPVILRQCAWRNTPLGKLKAIPEDGKPVGSYGTQDEAFTEVVQEVERAAKSRANSRQKAMSISPSGDNTANPSQPGPHFSNPQIGQPSAENSAVGLAKEFVSDERCKERLYDLVKEKIERLVSVLSDQETMVKAFNGGKLSLEMLKECRTLMGKLGGIVSVISVWGDGEKHERIIRLLFLNLVEVASTHESGPAPGAHWYPVHWLFYLAGISAVAHENYRMVAALFHIPIYYRGAEDPRPRRRRLLEVICGEAVRFDDMFPLHNGEIDFMAYDELAPIFSVAGIHLSKNDFSHSLCRLEMLQEIRYHQLAMSMGEEKGNGGALFAGRYSNIGRLRVLDLLLELAKEVGPDWPPLKMGLLEGPPEQIVRLIEDLSRRWGRGP